MVGMSTTPTKNGVSPNASMKPSIEPDEDLRQDGQQGGRDEQHDDRDGRAPGRTGVAGRLAVPAERLVAGS